MTKNLTRKIRGTNINSCKTCWFYIRDYNEFDKVHFYCHLTMKPIEEYVKNCKDYKPENTKEHIERQFQKMSKNMNIIKSIIEGRFENEDFKEIYDIVEDTQNRIDEIQKYKEDNL